MKSELPSPHFPQRLLHMDSTYQANLYTLLTSLKGVSSLQRRKEEMKGGGKREENLWQTLPHSFLCILGCHDQLAQGRPSMKAWAVPPWNLSWLG